MLCLQATVSEEVLAYLCLEPFGDRGVTSECFNLDVTYPVWMLSWSLSLFLSLCLDPFLSPCPGSEVLVCLLGLNHITSKPKKLSFHNFNVKSCPLLSCIELRQLFQFINVFLYVGGHFSLNIYELWLFISRGHTCVLSVSKASVKDIPAFLWHIDHL